MNHDDLLTRVQELRGRGLSPKQIARELGMRPAEVAPLLRQVAGAGRRTGPEQPLPEPADRELVGCWVTPGWSARLGLDDAPAWAASDPEGVDDPPSAGLAGVMIARVERPGRVTACGYLLDVHCLGVKNTLGPKTIGTGGLSAFSQRFFGGFDVLPRTAPLELAQQLVHGSVAYARSLGFEPHPDFAAAEPYLGTPPAPCPIRFGRDGTPFYMAGPHDNAPAVIRKLRASVGDGKFHYVAPL